MGEELGLVRGHVHTHGTFLLAALARQAQLEGLEDLVALPQIDLTGSVHHLEQEAGPASCGVLLLPGHHEARAHDAPAQAPALPHADATQRGVREVAVVLLVGEVHVDRLRPVVLALAKIGEDGARIDDLAWIHLPVRVPDGLELPEGLDQLVAIHLR